jgi:hypothetical protein
VAAGMLGACLMFNALAVSAEEGAGPPKGGGWYILRWVETPDTNGVAKEIKPEDRTEFKYVHSYERTNGDAGFAEAGKQLREGDVIAYRLPKWEARKQIFLKLDLTKIGYRLLKYGHLAIVVDDPANPGKLRVFSSQSFKGPNVREDIDTLRDHDWDVYRLDKWERVDVNRLREFVKLSQQKAGHWYGYDFSGMFGLWNSNLRPTKPDEIGHDYICSTIVLTALHYAGVQLDATARKGWLDLVSPYQVVKSKGRLVTPPSITLVADAAPLVNGRWFGDYLDP